MQIKPVHTVLLAILIAASLDVFSQASLTPNLIRNSYMNILDGTKPAGFNVSGNLVIEAVHPFTKGFEGPYSATAPTGAASSVNNATQQNPYWFGVYNKGSRITRGGMGDGWNSLPDGKILKITGNNSGANSTVTLPFEKNVLVSKVRFRAWVKIISGDFVAFGSDAGHNNQYWGGYQVSKATADQATDGWFYVDQVINTSHITALQNTAFSIGVKGTAIEVYIAMPYIAVLDERAWLPSVSDMLTRDGLFIHPQTQNVGIGTTDTKGYKFAVNGDAMFTKIKVKQYGSWPDYVFEPAYPLPSLPQLASFINTHKHLPGIPAACEVEKEGLDIADMNAKLLQKIEELTLYLIEQDKQFTEQRKQLAEKIRQLEKRLSTIEKN